MKIFLNLPKEKIHSYKLFSLITLFLIIINITIIILPIIIIFSGNNIYSYLKKEFTEKISVKYKDIFILKTKNEKISKIYSNLKIKNFDINENLEIKFQNENDFLNLDFFFPAEKNFNDLEIFLFFDIEFKNEKFSEFIFFSLDNFQKFNKGEIFLEIKKKGNYRRSEKMKIYNKKNNLEIKSLNLLIKENYLENDFFYIKKKSFFFDEKNSSDLNLFFKLENKIFYYYKFENQFFTNLIFFVIDYVIYFLPLYYLKNCFVNNILHEKLFK